MYLRRGSKPYNVLKCLLLAGGFVIVSTVSPASGAQIIRGLVRHYFYKQKFEKYRFLQDLKRLQSRELIDWRELPDGKIRITLTKLGTKFGKHRILVDDLDKIKLNRGKKWDGKWRVVIFDIPHTKRRARDAFRQKLNKLGFFPIQKSVFITPYECEDEIDFICAVFEIRRYVLIFYSSRFEGEIKLRKYFGL